MVFYLSDTTETNYGLHYISTNNSYYETYRAKVQKAEDNSAKTNSGQKGNIECDTPVDTETIGHQHQSLTTWNGEASWMQAAQRNEGEGLRRIVLSRGQVKIE